MYQTNTLVAFVKEKYVKHFWCYQIDIFGEKNKETFQNANGL